ncbi:uncharacterized protein LOC117998489 [Mirounga leonina]|uniref:uncharacterized protein LOC117998489 n=1 Tax=Mirounga leonina TaxID=9715 RepID=UPI00156C225F|nr:uncharacterized protein LOC117998489 [Mirounga leonina]
MTVYAEFQGVHKASRSLEGLPVNSSGGAGGEAAARAAQLADFPPAPRPRLLPQPLWEPRTFGPATAATLRGPNPTRAACRRAAIRAGRAGRSPDAVGGPGGAPVGSWEEGTPRPPLQARPRLLFSLLGTSYRGFSDELRPAPGVDLTVPLWWLLGVPGRDRTLMDPLHLQLSQLRRNLDSGGHTKNASLPPV